MYQGDSMQSLYQKPAGKEKKVHDYITPSPGTADRRGDQTGSRLIEEF
jgi:hypothetical protein